MWWNVTVLVISNQISERLIWTYWFMIIAEFLVIYAKVDEVVEGVQHQEKKKGYVLSPLWSWCEDSDYRGHTLSNWDSKEG